jgi:hypothetical protein
MEDLPLRILRQSMMRSSGDSQGSIGNDDETYNEEDVDDFIASERLPNERIVVVGRATEVNMQRVMPYRQLPLSSTPNQDYFPPSSSSVSSTMVRLPSVNLTQTNPSQSST